MSEPNQPYGAVPPPPAFPPAFPPPGGAPSAPGGPPSGPPFPPPGGPGGPGSSGGSGNGLWIALAVVGVLALAGVVVALVLLLTGSDSDDDDAKGRDTPSTTETTDPSTATPTDATTDAGTDATASTSGVPTDPTTSAGGAGGTSTADAVPNEPKAVVEAFLNSVVSADCATAEDLVTASYLKEEGDCDSSDIPTDFADQIKYTVGTPKVNDAAGTATVPVDVAYAGTKDSSTVKLVKVGGNWRVNEFD